MVCYILFRLENVLRNFSTLTRDDIIQIHYNEKIYEIKVLEVKPGNDGISIVETDLEVRIIITLSLRSFEISKILQFS